MDTSKASTKGDFLPITIESESKNKSNFLRTALTYFQFLSWWGVHIDKPYSWDSTLISRLYQFFIVKLQIAKFSDAVGNMTDRFTLARMNLPTASLIRDKSFVRFCTTWARPPNVTSPIFSSIPVSVTTSSTPVKKKNYMKNTCNNNKIRKVHVCAVWQATLVIWPSIIFW